jgi:hypothetical protein
MLGELSQEVSVTPGPYYSSFCCKRGYAAVTGSLAVQPFDILYEYALRASRLRVPVSLRVYTLLRPTFMNNAG